MKKFTPEMAVQNARMELVTVFPFFGSVFLRMNVFEDDTCDTAWTDGVSIGYSLKYTMTLTHLQIIGMFVHETLHVILKHHLRSLEDIRKKIQHGRWNHATDYALNPTIKRTDGMELHPNWLYRQEWDDDLAEEIFEQLEDDPLNDKYGDGDQMAGEVRPFPGKDKNGKPLKPGQLTKADIDNAGNEIDQWVRAAAFKAQGAGKMNGQTDRFITGAMQSEVRWEDELQFLAESITKDDYSWMRPCQAYTHMGLYLPSMTGTPNAVDMIFYVDTSGSLGQQHLKQIMGEVRNILDTFNIRVIVVYWDTEYNGLEIFDPEDVLEPTWKLNAKGGGGTDFTDFWEWMDDNIDDHDILPEACVVFSDMETAQFPVGEPDIPVIWAHVPDYGNSFNTNYLQYLPTDYGTYVKIPIYRGDEDNV